MPLRYNPTPFHQADYKTEINKELKAERELNAFFLIYGYIEAYLREWLFISGNIERKRINEKIIKEIERISFRNLLLVHEVLGNIDFKLFNKIREINEMRNKLAHNLIKIDIKDNNTREELRKIVLTGIEVCDELSNLYKNNLDRNAKKLAERFDK